MLAAFVALSPKTVVSVLPGAAQLYAMMGKPVNVGLKIENVRSTWSDAGGQRVLQVDGDIVNPTASEVSVPTVVVALQDNSRQGADAGHGQRALARRRRQDLLHAANSRSTGKRKQPQG